jgi:hypothetical protein
MGHTCHANACGAHCRPEHLMCPKHWSMVPEASKAAVLRHYRPGQCNDMRPSSEWIAAAKRAVLLVAIAEGAPMSKMQREQAAMIDASQGQEGGNG